MKTKEEKKKRTFVAMRVRCVACMYKKREGGKKKKQKYENERVEAI